MRPGLLCQAAQNQPGQEAEQHTAGGGEEDGEQCPFQASRFSADGQNCGGAGPMQQRKQDGADGGGLCPAVGGKEEVQLGAGQFTQISLCGISHDDDGKNDLIGRQAEQKSGQNRSIHSKQSAQRIQKASETGEKGGVVCSRQVGQKPDQQPGRNGSQNSAAEHFGGAVQQASCQCFEDLRFAVSGQLQYDCGGKTF